MSVVVSNPVSPERPEFRRAEKRERNGWFRRRRKIVIALGSIALVTLAWECYQVFLGDNFHEVVTGQIYRGSLPSPEKLERMVKKLGIRTVVNLRGLCNDLPWYLNECRTVQHLGISQQDVGVCANRLPPAQELRRLIKIVEHADYPIFFHCYRGADRTGLACVIAKIMRTDASLAEARGQLHWRYGHVAIGRTGWLDQFFDLYEDWLKEEKQPHSRERFRHWATKVYPVARCNYEVEEFCRVESEAKVRPRPTVYQVKMRNTGKVAWKFTPYVKSGYHLGYRVHTEHGKQITEGRAGLFDAVVMPGESFAAQVVLPTWITAGNYHIMIDLVDESVGWFYQTGQEPMEEEFVIRE